MEVDFGGAGSPMVMAGGASPAVGTPDHHHPDLGFEQTFRSFSFQPMTPASPFQRGGDGFDLAQVAQVATAGQDPGRSRVQSPPPPPSASALSFHDSIQSFSGLPTAPIPSPSLEEIVHSAPGTLGLGINDVPTFIDPFKVAWQPPPIQHPPANRPLQSSACSPSTASIGKASSGVKRHRRAEASPYGSPSTSADVHLPRGQTQPPYSRPSHKKVAVQQQQQQQQPTPPTVSHTGTLPMSTWSTEASPFGGASGSGMDLPFIPSWEASGAPAGGYATTSTSLYPAPAGSSGWETTFPQAAPAGQAFPPGLPFTSLPPPVAVSVQPPTPITHFASGRVYEPLDFDPDQIPYPTPVTSVESSGSATPASSSVPPSSASGRSSPAKPFEVLTGIDRRGINWGLTLDDFDIVRTLGTGTFGKVLLVRLRLDRAGLACGSHFALKVLNKVEVVRLKQVEHMNSEKDLLALVASDPTGATSSLCVKLLATFQDERNLYLLMEFVEGGELFSALRKTGRFAPDVARFFAANILLALEALHRQDIIYRDLKPENLLLGRNGYIKMTDFGFAKRVPDRTYTLCGTSEYIAPEIINAQGHGKPADWWAFGVLLYEMLAGYPPFYDDVPIKTYEKIANADYAFPRGMDSLARDLIGKLLTVDLTKRMGNLSRGAQDIKDHPWFAGVPWDALKEQTVQAPIVPHTKFNGDARFYERYPDAPLSELPAFHRAFLNRSFGGHHTSPEAASDPYRHLFETF